MTNWKDKIKIDQFLDKQIMSRSKKTGKIRVSWRKTKKFLKDNCDKDKFFLDYFLYGLNKKSNKYHFILKCSEKYWKKKNEQLRD